MQAHIRQRHDSPAPRYTSYPTAPHFTTGFGAERYGAWLEALDPAEPLSLYFHIPFCDSLCWFCGCNTTVVRRYEPVQRYVKKLIHEVELVAGHLAGRRRVSHIHFGGGSPSLLVPQDWHSLFDRIRAFFDLAENAEIAAEIDPRDLANENIAALAEVGINRVSFGVQDFDPEVQQAINRIQPFDMTAKKVEAFRAHGINALNIDLIYGLPLQTRARIEHSVACVIEMAPDRVALFGYAHVPWFKAHQKLIHEKDLPGGDARLGQFLAAAGCFEKAGYEWIGLDHFAQAQDGLAQAHDAGRLKRNFQGYTDDPAAALLGFGASAISSLPQGYVQNASHTPAYISAVDADTLAAERGIAISAEDILRRAIIEQLMCNLAVDLDALCDAHGFPPRPFEQELNALEALRRDGLVEIEGPHIAVTEPGRPLLRVICAAFDTYLESAAARHSRAV